MKKMIMLYEINQRLSWSLYCKCHHAWSYKCRNKVLLNMILKVKRFHDCVIFCQIWASHVKPLCETKESWYVFVSKADPKCLLIFVLARKVLIFGMFSCDLTNQTTWACATVWQKCSRGLTGIVFFVPLRSPLGEKVSSTPGRAHKTYERIGFQNHCFCIGNKYL